MKNVSGKIFNVYHRSEITGGICRHHFSAMEWNEAMYIRNHWNKRNPFHKEGAWIDLHDLQPQPVVMEVGEVSPSLTASPASFSTDHGWPFGI